MGRLTLLGLGQRSIQDGCIPRLSLRSTVWMTDEDEERVVMISRDVLGPDELERVQYACGKKGVDGEQRTRYRCCPLTSGRRNLISRTGHDPTCGLHYILPRYVVVQYLHSTWVYIHGTYYVGTVRPDLLLYLQPQQDTVAVIQHGEIQLLHIDHLEHSTRP